MFYFKRRRGWTEVFGFGLTELRVLDVRRDYLDALQVDARLVEVVLWRYRRAQGIVEGGILNFVDGQWHFMSGGVVSSAREDTEVTRIKIGQKGIFLIIWDSL